MSSWDAPEQVRIILRRRMGLLICAGCVLSLFFLRDVFILGSKQEQVPLKLLLYAILISLYLAGAIGFAYSLPEQRELELLRSRWVWVGVLALHVGLWRFAEQLKRGPQGKRRLWLTIVTPAPMFLLSAVVVSRHIAGTAESSQGLAIGSVASIAWIALVLTGVLAFRVAYRGWEDWDCVADVTAIASWTGFGILPFTGLFEWLQFS
jgi:hypothetical protein